MLSLLLLLLVGVPALLVVRLALGLSKNIRIAKASGLKYVVVPFMIYYLPWQILQPPILRFFDRCFPSLKNTLSRRLSQSDWGWLYRYEVFDRLGTDTFLTVTPMSIMGWTADADVITQVTTRRNDFPKPIQLYINVDVYGKNVVSTEGAAWRHQRKLTSPPFNEKNNHLVWTETLSQTQDMLAQWVDDKRPKTVHRVAGDTMRLSLHVISRAGFGQQISWPKEVDPDHPFAEDEAAPKGHSMSFTYSLHALLNNLLPVVILPKWFSRNAPFRSIRKSYEAYDEWRRYMLEMLADKKAALKSGAANATTIDVVGQLVKGQVDSSSDKSQNSAALTDSEVMGNSFVFILAGHETSANCIHNCLMLLAMRPDIQKQLQEELDQVFQGRPVSEWEYERDMPHLFGGVLGAVLAEQLRVIPPIATIPKSTYGVPDQTLIVEGKKVLVPANIHFGLCLAATHRNPKFWPHGPASDPKKPFFPPSNLDNDLEEFKPERWLKRTDAPANQAEKNPSMPKPAKDSPPETDDLNVNTAADTAASLYAPYKGSYIPFSEGYRACLGRRFAQVEILAALSVILSQYSTELALDEWATEEQVDAMSKEEKRALWEKAKDSANDKWQHKMSSRITLKIRGDHVPLSFVKRGNERLRDIF